MTRERPAPIAADQRIDTLDVLRGIAICGILLMNIPHMGAIARTEGLLRPFRPNADWLLYIVQQMLFEGTMRGLFTLLFGAGMLLMLRRSEGADGQVTPIDVWTRRCLWLMVFGCVQWALFLWPGEILFNYGVTGLFLLVLRTARPRTLLIAAVLPLVAASAFYWSYQADAIATAQTAVRAEALHHAGKPLSDEQEQAITAADKDRHAVLPRPEDVARERHTRTHLATLLKRSWRRWSDNNVGWPGLWWGLAESGGFMLIGMALFRMGVLTGEASRRTYALLTAIGYGGGLAFRAMHIADGFATGFDLSVAAAPILGQVDWACYEIGRLLMTLGHLGLIILLYRSGALGRAWPLRVLGRMALTVYSLQSILTSLLFYAFGMIGMLGFAGLMGVAAAIWIATGLFAVWWLARHDMGPAEQALRALAYWSFSPRRRPIAAPAIAATPAI